MTKLINQGVYEAQRIANLVRQANNGNVQADKEAKTTKISYAENTDKGGISVEKGMAFSEENLKMYDANRDGVVSSSERGSIGKTADLNDDGIISAAENLAITMATDYIVNKTDSKQYVSNTIHDRDRGNILKGVSGNYSLDQEKKLSDLMSPSNYNEYLGYTTHISSNNVQGYAKFFMKEFALEEKETIAKQQKELNALRESHHNRTIMSPAYAAEQLENEFAYAEKQLIAKQQKELEAQKQKELKVQPQNKYYSSYLPAPASTYVQDLLWKQPVIKQQTQVQQSQPQNNSISYPQSQNTYNPTYLPSFDVQQLFQQIKDFGSSFIFESNTNNSNYVQDCLWNQPAQQQMPEKQQIESYQSLAELQSGMKQQNQVQQSQLQLVNRDYLSSSNNFNNIAYYG
ncbi:MAG: hypothetical protein AB1782_00295 [Cyanobacteriota bacterium]